MTTLLDGVPRIADYYAPPQGPLVAAGKLFTVAGQPYRWRGVSAFPLCRQFADGVDIRPFLSDYVGYNTLRVWDYREGLYESCRPDQWANFLSYVGGLGWRVELTLLTSDSPGRIEPAKALVSALAPFRFPHLTLEIGNEPLTNKTINVWALEDACRKSGYLYSSGLYEDTRRNWFGAFGCAHTPRDHEWPRKSHDLMEYWNGGGPSYPDEPACRVPWVSDEPIRPDEAGYAELDYYSYGASLCGFGAGGTFHSAGGRDGRRLTADERRCAEHFLLGLNTLPEDAATYPYGRIDEHGATLRTFTFGNYCVRIRPTTPGPVGAWTIPLDNWGIVWRKP